MNSKEIPVFNVERFAIHDGQGIRTVVFLQGCPMRCLWCANPESQTVGTHIMQISSRCTGCGRCVGICPLNCLEIKNLKSEIDRKVCISCGKCAEVCLNDALKISGNLMSCKEIFEVVMRDRIYYEESGGGVTFSGGEALLHTKKLLPLLAALKAEGINITFETCGCVPISDIQNVAEFTDTFLFDIKSLNADKFAAYTKGSLQTVLTAFEYLCRVSPDKVIARVPVIPSFNSTDEDISGIMEYACKNGVKEVHLLPYHTLGISKYEQLGREYPFDCKTPLQINEVEKLAKIGRSFGLKIKIGG